MSTNRRIATARRFLFSPPPPLSTHPNFTRLAMSMNPYWRGTCRTWNTQEFSALQKNPVDNVKIEPDENNVLHWTGLQSSCRSILLGWQHGLLTDRWFHEFRFRLHHWTCRFVLTRLTRFDWDWPCTLFPLPLIKADSPYQGLYNPGQDSLSRSTDCWHSMDLPQSRWNFQDRSHFPFRIPL